MTTNDILYFDSFYSSPDLLQELKKIQIGACETVAENIKHYPEALKKKTTKGRMYVLLL